MQVLEQMNVVKCFCVEEEDTHSHRNYDAFVNVEDSNKMAKVFKFVMVIDGIKTVRVDLLK